MLRGSQQIYTDAKCIVNHKDLQQQAGPLVAALQMAMLHVPLIAAGKLTVAHVHVRSIPRHNAQLVSQHFVADD